jgi:hypothetical protein
LNITQNFQIIEIKLNLIISPNEYWLWRKMHFRNNWQHFERISMLYNFLTKFSHLILLKFNFFLFEYFEFFLVVNVNSFSAFYFSRWKQYLDLIYRRSFNNFQWYDVTKYSFKCWFSTVTQTCNYGNLFLYERGIRQTFMA